MSICNTQGDISKTTDWLWTDHVLWNNYYIILPRMRLVISEIDVCLLMENGIKRIFPEGQT